MGNISNIDQMKAEYESQIKELTELLQKLDDENEFLTETILEKKMGKIVTERKKLLKKVREAEKAVADIKADTESKENEYQTKLDKLASMTHDVISKQNDIDSYIDQTSSDKISEYKKKLIVSANSKIEKYKEECDARISEISKKNARSKIIIIILSIYAVLVTGIVVYMLL